MSVLIPNFSQFYYGFQVTTEPYNGYIDIDEGAGEIGVEVAVGSYTLNEFALAIKEALDTQAVNNYVVSVDRATRRITISSTSNFEILANTGTHFGSSLLPTMGFSTSSDRSGDDSYTSDLFAGKVYHPQFYLQSYISPDDWQQRNEASVNVSASGSQVEVINFGIAKFCQMDIKFITNKLMDGVVIKNNSQGLEDARDFLRYITNKNFFEFMPNINQANTFYKVLLESTPDYSDGTGYKLKELWDQGLPGIFETGVIKLRVLE